MPTLPHPVRRSLHVLILIVAAIFLALHCVHLKADFPNHSPWKDWSKYTDEGWYGDAAIRHFLLGHWYVPGDFNPAAALPVWPFLEGLALPLHRRLPRRRPRPHRLPSSPESSSPAGSSCAHMPVHPGATRRAHRRPAPRRQPVLLRLHPPRHPRAAAHPPHPARSTAPHLQSRPANPCLRPILALGVLIPLMVLTKTTALFLFPAIFWMLFARAGYRIRPFLRIAFPAALLAVALWLAYFFLVVRPHYLVDYRYLFTANAYTGITSLNAWTVIASHLHRRHVDRPRPLPLHPGRRRSSPSCTRAACSPTPSSPRFCSGSPATSPSSPTTTTSSPVTTSSSPSPSRCSLPFVIQQLILPACSRTHRRLAIAVSFALIAVIVVPDARRPSASSATPNTPSSTPPGRSTTTSSPTAAPTPPTASSSSPSPAPTSPS